MSIRKNELLVVALFFVLLSQIGTFGLNQVANGQTETGIPAWIKNNAGWWANGDIDDNSFVQGIQFLIKEGIMEIPPTEPDLDRDGIPDTKDKCPTKAETINGHMDSDGCPDSIPTDTDGDGIEDGDDNCPSVLNVSQIDFDDDGIGNECDSDIDGDGILNDEDLCPSEPENYNSFEDSNGCPDERPETSKSLTISDIDVEWENSGWGDHNVFLRWTYHVEHDDENETNFPTQGHFVIKITGFGVPITDEATYDGDNRFSGEYLKGIDAGEEGGTITLTVLSFIGDNRGEYIGDGDQKEIIIPPNNAENE